MKKLNLLLTISILTLTFSTITAQALFISAKAGDWNSPSTWSNDPNATEIPNSLSSVIVNHTISVPNGGACMHLSINSRVYSGSTIHIYGDLLNKGELRDDPNHGSDYLTIIINGSIINDGIYSTGNTYFVGNKSHHLQTINGNTLSFGMAFGGNSEVSFVVDRVAYISGTFLLNGSKLLLPGGNLVKDTLVLFNNGLIDGGVIECNDNVILGKGNNGTIGFNGNVSFNPQQTFVKDAILEGFININGTGADSLNYTTSFIGEVINNGTIITAPHNMGNEASIFIEGNFTNNGIIKNQSNGLNLFFKQNGSVINNGKLQNKRITFAGNNTFTNNSDSLSVLEIRGVDGNSTITINKDLLFNVDAMINMNGGKMILSNSAVLDGFGMENTILEANGAVISTRDNAKIITSKIKDMNAKAVSIGYGTKLIGEINIFENGKLFFGSSYLVNIIGNITNNGTLTGRIDSTIIGNIKNNGLWKSDCSIDGDVINNGIIDNYSFLITGDITNSGSWNSISSIELNGSEDQLVSMPTDSTIHTNQVKFNAMLEGTNYQWQRNGEDITDAVYSNYTIWSTGLLPDNATYYCVVDGNNSRNIIIQSLTDVNDDEIIENEIQLPTEYSLSQNYPNPFNPSTVIEFALPTKGNVSLKVFNSLGEEVAKLVNREMNAGYHSVNFDARNLSSGIYFYRISSGNFVQTKKMLLIR